MQNPPVSIAMCTYNGEKYLEEQLDSILNQTYVDFELIICDDGSTDKTIEIINQYACNDDRIKLFQNAKNLGFVKNFEKAISLCEGDFIALADQDDIWYKKKLEMYLTVIDQHVLIYSDLYLMDKDGKKSTIRFIAPGANLMSGQCHKAFIHANCVSGNTLMFKKELIKHILPIPKKINYHDLWIAWVASVYGTITYIAEPMVYYRRYEEQITHNKELPKNFFDRSKSLQESHSNSIKVQLNNLEAFASLKILQDATTIKILNELVNHYREYNSCFFNRKLYKLLRKHSREVFGIRQDSHRKHEIKKICIGMLFHKLTFFMFFDREQNLLRKIRKSSKTLRERMFKRT